MNQDPRTPAAEVRQEPPGHGPGDGGPRAQARTYGYAAEAVGEAAGEALAINAPSEGCEF